jgi:hypothetical protein
MEVQKIDLYAPIMAARKGPPPIALRVGVQPADVHTVGGPLVSSVKAETYVLLSALPEELRRRVETAVQALIAGQ